MATKARFGRTWWGEAWIRALEDAAALDPGRLARGRTYARNGRVGPLDIQPGFVATRVTGSHGRYYRTDVAVRALAPSEWEQVADAIAAKAGHAAALLDGELDPGIVDDVAEFDIRLLPGAGDLRPDCTCPDWAEPCKHAAALCYLVADELDRDPFLLFLLRGLGRDDLLAMVRDRRGGGSSAADGGSAETFGVNAIDAWAALPFGEALPPVPPEVSAALSHLPARAISPPAWDVRPPAGSGIDARAIDGLAADAAERAFAALVDGTSLGLHGNLAADLARRAARLDRRDTDALGRRLGLRPGQMAARVEAWERGGELGVAMLEDDDLWVTDQTLLSAGRDSLVDLGYRRRSVALNYDSLRLAGNVWLALGPDRRWYRFDEQGQRRELHLVAEPSTDVCDLVDPPPPDR